MAGGQRRWDGSLLSDVSIGYVGGAFLIVSGTLTRAYFRIAGRGREWGERSLGGIEF